MGVFVNLSNKRLCLCCFRADNNGSWEARRIRAYERIATELVRPDAIEVDLCDAVSTERSWSTVAALFLVGVRPGR